MRFLSMLLCTVLALTAFSCKKQAPENQKPKERPPAMISASPAEAREIPVRLTAIGTAEAVSTVSISSRVEGAIEAVHFTEGQDVKKGDLLFTMDPKPFQAALDGALANLAREKSLLEQYRRDRDRAESIYKQDFISRQDYDAAVTKAAAQESVIASYQAAVDQAKLKLDYCAIRSAVSGRTGSLAVNAGNVVKADPASVLVVIRQMEPINIRFSVPQKELSAIRKATASNTLKVTARVSGGPEEGQAGSLAFLDNQVDASTGTVMLKAVFPNRDRSLWPGQFADVTLDIATIKDAVVIPARALQNGPKGPIVFKVAKDMTVEVFPVVPGETLGEDMVITEGVLPGDLVVTEGHLTLKPGAKIKLAEGLRGAESEPGAAGKASH